MPEFHERAFNGNQGEILSNVDVGTNINDVMMRGSNGNLEKSSLESELELLLRARPNRGTIGSERDLNMFRSGSAPPTVEGSLTSVGSLFENPNFVQIDNSYGNGSSANGVLSEEEIRSHPAYLSYYYSHENLNPRLPPPLLSKEDWRVAQRFQSRGSSFGGIGDLRKNFVDDGGGSLFSMQPGIAVNGAEDELMELRKAAKRNMSQKNSAELLHRGSDGLIVEPRAGMGMRRRSFADILQEGLEQPTSLSSCLSQRSIRNSFSEIVDARSFSRPDSSELCNGTASTESLHPGTVAAGLPRVHNHGLAVPHYFASALGSSLSRSGTPEIHLVGRSPSPSLAPNRSRISLVENKIDGSNALNHSSSMTELADVAGSLSGLSLSKHDDLLQSQLPKRFDKESSKPLDMPNGYRQSLQQQYTDWSRAEKLAFATNGVDSLKENGLVTDLNAVKLGINEQANFPRRTSSSTNLKSKLNSSGVVSLESTYLAENYPHMDFAGHSGYFTGQKLRTAVNNQLDKAATFSVTGNGQKLRSSNQPASDLHLPLPVMDPLYIHYLQQSSHYAAHAAAFGDPSQQGNSAGPSFGNGDLQSLQKAYLATLVAQQKQQYNSSFLGKSSSLNHQYYGNPSFRPAMRYQAVPIASSVPSFGSGSPILQKDQISGFTSMLQSPMGGSSGSLLPETGIKVEASFTASLQEEIKNNKSRSFELSDIVDHVVKFSTDQYGSRFIQQKLETASEEEKMKIFPEIILHAHSLMTDVFGNYVIQKFFEHGTESERMELANHLTGHVLPLSLQMYGCRVIQKALEVVDVDQQTKMVAELDGSIMKCVRDQNGNHVIQKCIECVPQHRILFIVSSFFGEVVSLSTHPYGCRVIQRVLEHCDEPNTQQIIMDEIMNSVCTLAQNQYGNYVIQHVLQHGKPYERSVIIQKLAGQIVKMSQQKFASNVVEKCLTFGGPEERQLLVNEMLGSTDENEPLQAMMKDPFGNYVVQKVLETCDDHSRELILSRIKVHLSALKRYTYGKHIVSRVEKLVTAGERHMALSSSHSS